MLEAEGQFCGKGEILVSVEDGGSSAGLTLFNGKQLGQMPVEGGKITSP